MPPAKKTNTPTDSPAPTSKRKYNKKQETDEIYDPLYDDKEMTKFLRNLKRNNDAEYNELKRILEEMEPFNRNEKTSSAKTGKFSKDTATKSPMASPKSICLECKSTPFSPLMGPEKSVSNKSPKSPKKPRKNSWSIDSLERIPSI